ncbi:MAG: T9SS type A sorting domain-containing protein [Cytophagaceae bacterium]|nr:T9SS type A sorting domain-containing protein [Cytophagaceae bacterium]
MKLTLKIVLLFLLLGTSIVSQAQRVVGYMPYWAGDANLIQYSKLTHINYAFALPNADGSIKPISEVAKLQTIVTRAHAAGAKVLIAIGGWSDNGEVLDSRFEQLAGNATSRARFVSAAMGLITTYNLDGIDIDWEYPDAGQSSNNYDLLMTDLSDQLKPQGKLLSAAVTASYNGDGVSLTALSKMDYVNIMAYDENEFQHSTFDFAVASLNYWAGRGVAKNKLNLGVPFYGKQGGEVSYSTILSRGGDPNADVFGSIGYNGLVTMRRKAQYVKDQGYGGIMIWELSEDVTTSNSLVSAIYDVLGGTTTPVNQAPIVTLTSPAAGATAVSPAVFTLTATATDADGSIAKVEFYNGSTLLFTDNIAPFTYSWTGVTAGSYILTAKATDNLGLSTTSASRTVTVTTTTPVNQVPVVNLTSPINGASAVAPASFTLTAAATDADGSVAKVDFYNGATLLFSDNAAPFNYSWTGVVAGTYTLTAKATDNAGASATSTAVVVSATASSGNQAPTVRITAPVNNGTYNSPAVITIMADATDADGSIAKVDFYNGATLIGTDNTSPYYIVWSNVGGGTYPVTAVATDNGGLTKTSSIVNVVVYGVVVTPSNQAPVVSLTAPVNGTSVIAPGSFNLTATASDADGSIAFVAFYSGTTLLFTDNAAPYAYTWPNIGAGAYTLSAKATDNLGLSTTSSAVTVTVTTVTPANQSPSVSLTAPTNGTSTTAPGTFNLTAAAADADGSVVKVEFYNGTILLFTDNAAPYAYAWTNLAVGSYTVSAKATDNAGSVTASSVVTVSVVASGGSCTAPLWDASVAYVGGNIVQYGGIKYKANWWTLGDRPDVNNGVYGTGMVWTSQGGCNAREGYTNTADAETTAQTLTLSPNPVEHIGLVTLNLLEDDQVEIHVMDVNGRIMSTLFTGNISYGSHSFTLNSVLLAPGIYHVIMKGEKGNVSVNLIKN